MPSVPRAHTSIRSALHEEAAGADVGSSSPPSDSHGCQEVPSQYRFHSSPSPNTAKTWSWSGLQAVALAGDARGPPSDSGSSQAPSRQALWTSPLSAAVQNRSIRLVPQESVAVTSVIGVVPPSRRLLRRRERTAASFGNGLAVGPERRGGDAPRQCETEGERS